MTKMAACSKDFLCRDNFDATLVIFQCHDYSTNVYEAVAKIVLDENDYRKCFFAL